VEGWYNDVVTDHIKIEDGYLSLNGKPGLGISLRPEFVESEQSRVEVSTEDQTRKW
jgi:L-alanine-DL-glutamate epimerase-like enolase superfamily enzyme